MAKKKPRKTSSEDDELPDRTKEKKGGSNTLLIALVAGGAAVLLLCVCGGTGIGAFIYWGKPAGGGGGGQVAKDGAAEKDKADNKGRKKKDMVVILNPANADIANDPKWHANPDLNKLLPGRWRAHTAFGYDLGANGTMEKVGLMPEKGRFKVTGAETVDLTAKPAMMPNPVEKTRTSVVLINDDELAFLTQSKLGDAKPNDYILDGPYYRMRDDGTGLGRTKIIDPLIEKLKTGAPNDKALAMETLGLLGPDAWPAVPELAKLLDAKDQNAGRAISALVKMGPKAKLAVPALRKYLTDQKHWRGAVLALGEIGPEAKDALPDLRKMLPNAEAQGAIQRIDPTAKF